MTERFPCIPEDLGSEILEPLIANKYNWPSDGNRIIAFLAHQLACPIDARPTAEEKRALDAICRKVDIAKKLLDHYDGKWKAPVSDALINEHAWRLTALLFIHVSQFYLSEGANGRGQALKYLNTAFNAASFTPDHKQVLHQLAEARLKGLLVL